jgi:hypothetical protein
MPIGWDVFNAVIGTLSLFSQNTIMITTVTKYPPSNEHPKQMLRFEKYIQNYALVEDFGKIR